MKIKRAITIDQNNTEDVLWSVNAWFICSHIDKSKARTRRCSLSRPITLRKSSNLIEGGSPPSYTVSLEGYSSAASNFKPRHHHQGSIQGEIRKPPMNTEPSARHIPEHRPSKENRHRSKEPSRRVWCAIGNRGDGRKGIISAIQRGCRGYGRIGTRRRGV